jgi:hypothetical protein
VVDFPVDDGAITPRQASKRLAIWLWLGLCAFAGVVIIPLFIAGGGFKLPELTCNDVIVGHTPDMLMLLGVGGSSPIYEPRYQIVIRDIPIPVPPTLTKMFMKGSRCGQP